MNKTKLPSLIPILILTLVTVVMWVSFDVYRAFNKPVETKIPVTVSEPLTPSLDKDAIKQIESRNYLDDSQIPENIISSSPIPSTNLPSPTPTATIEASATPTNASGSAVTQ
ncbi:MAG TPA: hypothetical protein VKC53_00900 [Patescibacteria group bacterium]|nr:hypothetical protein [Patescibacteria group bacterium]